MAAMHVEYIFPADDSIEPYLQKLTDPDEERRYRAAIALGEFKSQQAVHHFSMPSLTKMKMFAQPQPRP